MVLEWASLHRTELRRNWELARNGVPVFPIAPLRLYQRKTCWRPEIERQQKLGKEVVFRADAAVAKPEVYDALEERERHTAHRIWSRLTIERPEVEVAESTLREYVQPRT